MVNVEYANAYSEVLEILKFISKEDYNKIPANKIELFKLNSNKEYKFTYSPNKTLDEQNVSKRAKAIIGILFRDYWATEVQRDKIIRKQKNDRLTLDEQKKSLYGIENIFCYVWRNADGGTMGWGETVILGCHKNNGLVEIEQ